MKKAFVLAGCLSLMLAGCGGDDGGSVAAPPPAPVPQPKPAAPGGLYVGYYQEDRTSNPEDPMSGTLFLNLPEGDADFAGRMSFTYVGCQTANVGTISGTKSDTGLDGKWTGAVDNLPQSGLYKGTYNSLQQLYSGTYTNSGGKQYRDLRPCIEYYIAPNGTWELFPLNTTVSTQPSAVGVIIEGNKITWYPPAGTQASLVSIVDKALASAGAENAIVMQDVVLGGAATYTFAPGLLVTKRTYIIGVGSSDGGVRTYYSSKEIVAP